MNDRFSMNGDGKKPAPAEEQEKKIIEALTGRYDELEQLWEKAEKDLKRFRVPHDIRHRYLTKYLGEDPEGPAFQFYLGFVKYGKGWRICHGCYFDEDRDGDIDWKPVIESTVDVRLETIPHFEELRKKVIEAAEKCVPKLDKAIAEFRTVLKR
jgi:hypothetical protein